MPDRKKIIISVTSDLCTDQRVNRSAVTLQQKGFDVLLVGRKLPGSCELENRSYKVKRFKLWFHTGPLFYAVYNLRLFIFLLMNKADVLFSNDLDTLLSNYLVSKIKNIPLTYDSHEYYTGVPELQNRAFVRGTWKTIERNIFPKLKRAITVNESIADLYYKEYKVRPVVVRNVPDRETNPVIKNRQSLGLLAEDKIILMQGAGINIHRGAEEAVNAMKFLEGVKLLIIGGGDVMPSLKIIVKDNHLEDKIIFKPKMSYSEMMSYTRLADIGLTLDKETSVNYKFSLPNKLFDYIHAGIPVLASRLPEVEKIITGYDIGTFIDRHDPEHIAQRIKYILSHPELLERWKKNLAAASEELNWNEEKKKFLKVFDGFQG